MIRLLARFSVHRPVTVLMAFLALCLLGAIAWSRIPLQMMPDGFVLPNLWVGVNYENATPMEVEAQISRPIEEQLATIAGIKDLSTSSNSDGASFDLEFSRDTSMDAAYNDVVDRMERAMSDLPRDVENYWIWRWNPSDEPIVWAGVSLPEDVEDPYWLLSQVVQKRVERVPGVGKVESWGADPRRLYVEFSLDELARNRVNLSAVLGRLMADNFQLASGRVEDRGRVRYVRSLARWQDPDALRALPVASGLRLGDIAEVSMKEVKDPTINHINGREGAAIAVYKESGANTVTTALGATAALAALEKDPRLAGARFFTFFDQGKLIRGSLDQVLRNALEGGVLAVLILGIFLRDLRMTLLVASSIPFCLLLTVMILYFTGGSLNLISLMGLMIAVGMVVDNAIVVMESIYLRRQAGDDVRRAAVEGTHEVGLALVLSTGVSVVVFLPVILMSGDAQFSFFLGALGYPVVFALLASLGVALVFTPLTTTFVRGGAVAEGVRHDLPRWSERMVAGYQRILRRILERRADSGVGIFAMVVLTLVIPARSVSCKDSAEGNMNDFRVRYEVPSNMSYADRLAAVKQVEAFVEANADRWGVEVHRSRLGSSGRRGNTWVTLKEEVPDGALDRAAVIADAKAHLPDIPGVNLTVGRSERESDSSSVGLTLRGEDTGALIALSDEVQRRLRSLDGVLSVGSDVESGGGEEVRLTVDRAAASRAGLSASDIGRTVAFALRGTTLKPLTLPDREVATRAVFRAEDRADLPALMNFPIYSATGGSEPLRAVVHDEVGQGMSGIRREQRQTSWPMTIELAPDANGESVRGAIATELNGMTWPRGYRWDWGMSEQGDDEDLDALLMALGLSVVFVFVLMGVLFESFLLPLAILTTIPMAMLGVFWTLHFSDTPLDVMGFIGLVILVGVVVNHGVVLLDAVRHRRVDGMDRTDAIVDAGGRRLRPVLMTTLTTIVGLLPMALGNATFVGIPYAPMGRVLAGGMATGTILTLFFLPYLYAVLDDMRLSGRRWLGWVAGPAGPSMRAWRRR